MSLNDSSFNTSLQCKLSEIFKTSYQIKTLFFSVVPLADFTESVLEESAPLDKNVNFSKLELSQILSEDSTLQNTKNITQSCAPLPKLSITLDQEEKDILRKCYANGKENNSSLMDITQASNNNNTLQNTTETLKESSKLSLTKSRTTTHTKLAMEVSNVEEEEDESVIPVEEEEEEEDDDIEEVSTLDSSTLETPQKDMFSHLQPNKTAEEKDTALEDNQQESMLVEEQECSEFVQDESKLFQYPLVELGRRLWLSTAEKQLYTKGCLWSPDGTCVLVPVNSDGEFEEGI